MSSEYEHAVNALLKDVKELRADMKGVLGALHGKAKDYVEHAKESLQESVADRVERVRDAAAAVGHNCQDASKECVTKIKEHPFASVLAALGVGMILGGLLRRRHS